MASLTAASLRGWTPVRIAGTPQHPTVEWAVVSDDFSDPFFEQTADRAMRRPFNLAFGRSTPLADLETAAGAERAIEPAGLVFHMSRCGSTLIARMLSQLSESLVLSEAQPVDAVLRLGRATAEDDDALAQRLRALFAAFSNRPGVRRLFVKLHAWHVLELPLFERAFPRTPWVFAFREPRAVLRSHERAPGAELMYGAIDPAHVVDSPARAAAIPPDEYAARVLRVFCDAALRHAGRRSRFIDYATLPRAVLATVAPLFGVVPSADEAQRMLEIANVDAKTGGSFRGEEPGEAPARRHDLAAAWLDRTYEQLRQ